MNYNILVSYNDTGKQNERTVKLMKVKYKLLLLFYQPTLYRQLFPFLKLISKKTTFVVILYANIIYIVEPQYM